MNVDTLSSTMNVGGSIYFNYLLPDVIIYGIFESLTKAEAIKLSCTSKYFKKMFEYFLERCSHSQCIVYKDLAYEIFKSRVAREGVYTWHLLTLEKPLRDLKILMNMPKLKTETLLQQGLVDCPENYPINAKVPDLKQRLPKMLFGKIWSRRFQVPEERIDPALESKYKYKDDADKNHFSAMTKAILVLFKDELVINDRFLRLLTFHELHSAFLCLFDQREYHGISIQTFLPFTIMFPEGLSKDVLNSLGKYLRVQHYAYLNKYLPVDAMISLTAVWKVHREFQLFLRTLDGMKDYQYLLWLKQGKGKKFILPVM